MKTKKQIKTFVSIFLSVIMAFSIFTIIPFTAAAESQPADEGEINIVRRCTIFTSSAQSNHPQSNITDGNDNNFWASSDDYNPQTVTIYLPHNIKSLREFGWKFEQVSDYRSSDFLIEISTNGYNYQELTREDDHVWFSNQDRSYTYTFRDDDAYRAENIRSIRITFSDRKYFDSNHVSGTPTFGHTMSSLYINGVLSTTTAKALYASHKIEWVMTNETSAPAPAASEFKVWQKAPNAAEWTNIQNPQGGITKADVDAFAGLAHNESGAKSYYTAIVEVGNGVEPGYKYAVTKSDVENFVEGTTSTIGSIAEVTETTGIDAMSRNALVSLDFGPEGLDFAANSVTTINHPIILSKLKAMKGGSIRVGFSTSITNGQIVGFTGNTSIYSSVSIEDGYLIFGNAVAGTNKHLQMNGDVDVHSYMISTDGSTYVHHDNDGNDGEQINGGSRSYDLFTSGLTSVTLGSSSFSGTIYSLLITEEYFPHYEVEADQTDIVREVSKIRPSIHLNEMINYVESHVSEKGDLNLYEESVLTEYNDALANAKNTLVNFEYSDATTEQNCQAALDRLENAYNALNEDNLKKIFVLTFQAGYGANHKIGITTDYTGGDNEVVKVDEDTHRVYISRSYNTDLNIILTPSPQMEGLQFDGWYEMPSGSQASTVDGENGGYTLTVSSQAEKTDKTYECRYQNTNLNGAVAPSPGDGATYPESSELSHLKKLNDEYREELMANSSSNSSNKLNSENPGGQGERPMDAFDGRVGYWWHQNYGNDASIETHGSNSAVTDNNRIWLQSGFNEPHNIGAIGYIPKNALINNAESQINTCILNFEIWLSNDPQFNDYYVADVASIVAGGQQSESTTSFNASNTLKNEGNWNAVYAKEQMVYFSVPYEVKYVRLVAKSTTNTRAAVDELNIYEYIGEEEENVPITFNFSDQTDGENFTGNNRATPIEKQINVHVLNNAEEPSDMVISREAFNDACIESVNTFFEGYNSLAYDYKVITDTFSTTEHTCKILVTDASYHLDAVVGENVISAEGNYGKVFKTSTGDYVDANEMSDFNHWIKMKETSGGDWADTEEVIYADSFFRLIATENMRIKAVKTALTDSYAAYIPDPIVSRDVSSADKYRVEIPVTLMNVIEYTGGSNYKIKDDVLKFGIVIDNSQEGVQKTDIETFLLGSTSNSDLTKSEAYNKSSTNPSSPKLTNKGRYLHKLKVGTAAAEKYDNSKVYAYLIVNGSDGQSQCILSCEKTLSFSL